MRIEHDRRESIKPCHYYRHSKAERQQDRYNVYSLYSITFNTNNFSHMSTTYVQIYLSDCFMFEI